MRSKIKPFCQSIFNYLILVASFVVSPGVWAAACCGGGFATPSLIVGDDKALLTTSIAHSEILADVASDSLWRKRDAPETSETFKIEAAHIFWDRFQAGLSLPIVERSRAGHSSSGLGDIASTLGYEFLPDWDYNPWRPRGLGFLQLTLPTGRSIHESDALYQLDSRGRGFWSIGAGTIFTKVMGRTDVFTTFDMHRSLNKDYSNSQTQGTLKPGYGGNLGFGAGYSWGDLRLGSSLTWTYEDPISVSGTVTTNGAAQRFATATLSVSYLLRQEWAATLTYADQTLFGDPTNSSLGRGVMLFLQRRWLR